MATFTILNAPLVVSAFSPLWVAVGRENNVAYSSDGISWTSYQSTEPVSTGGQAIAFGKDADGNDLWIKSRWWDTTAEVSVSSDPTQSGSWTVRNTPMTSSIDVAYGNNVWVAVGRDGTSRSTDGGQTWPLVTLPGGAAMSSNAANASVATDGSGNWVIIADDGSQYKVYKSLDDGVTWSVTKTWGWLASAQYAAKEVSFGNGSWMLATADKKIRMCTAAGLATDSWVDVETLSDIARDVQYGYTSGGDEVWMAVGHDKKCWLSVNNGVTWTQASDIHHAQPAGIYEGVHAKNVAYYDGAWVAVLDSLDQNNIFRSVDNGTTWTAVGNSGDSLFGIAINKVLPNT